MDFEPGSDWHYANHAWGILGAIVSKIEGDTWQNVIHKEIFSKLQMNDSYAHDDPVDGMSVGYHRDEGHDEIADWFETLAKAERSHANRFTKALESIS